MSAALADEAVEQAGRLLDLWSALAMRHVALGTGCACGMGGVSLRLEDFELDIAGYLEDAGIRSGIDEVVRFFEAAQQAGPRDEPLRVLLRDVQEGRLSSVVTDWLLPRVERTLRSFAELHGPAIQG